MIDDKIARRLLAPLLIAVAVSGCAFNSSRTAAVQAPTVTAKATGSDYSSRLALAGEARCAPFVSVGLASSVLAPGQSADTSLRIIHDSAESPTQALIRLTSAGLLDDSVSTERLKITLEKDKNRCWQVLEVEQTRQCARGKNAGKFQTARCP